jgi:hypothetical protein
MVLLPLQLDHLDVRSVTAQTEPELLGWCIRRETNSKPVPATTVLHTKEGSGSQNFLTLLIPLRPGNSSPLGSVQSTGPDSALVTFSDGRTLEVDADPDPSGGMEVVETLPNGSVGRHVKVASAPRAIISDKVTSEEK